MSSVRAFLCAAILVLFTTSLAAQGRELVLSGASPLGECVLGDFEPAPPGVYVGQGRDSVDWGHLAIYLYGPVEPGDYIHVSLSCSSGSVYLRDQTGMAQVLPGQGHDWDAGESPLYLRIEGV